LSIFLATPPLSSDDPPCCRPTTPPCYHPTFSGKKCLKHIARGASFLKKKYTIGDNRGAPKLSRIRKAGNRQNRPQKHWTEKGPFGPFLAFPRPGPDREVSERVHEGLGRHPGGYGRHLNVFRVILGGTGHFGRPFRYHVRVSKN